MCAVLFQSDFAMMSSGDYGIMHALSRDNQYVLREGSAQVISSLVSAWREQSLTSVQPSCHEILKYCSSTGKAQPIYFRISQWSDTERAFAGCGVGEAGAGGPGPAHAKPHSTCHCSPPVYHPERRPDRVSALALLAGSTGPFDTCFVWSQMYNRG